MTELIGRDREIDDVAARLAARRLVTVTGPGGIGKTSVARAVAERAGATYELGARTVDLTRVDSPDAVAGTIAGQLGFPSFEALLASPSDRSVLVIVDNCEHVTASAADAVAALLDACAAPTVLATSRVPLDIPGESLVVLGPLPVPADGRVDREGPAVRLFLERARDAGADLGRGRAGEGELDEAQLRVVGELCRRVDGVPLAIEIAAARTRTMHPTEILERLDEGVTVLTRSRFRGDPRHRSVAETIDWSYRLLDADAAALFEQLGVLPGPFAIPLAEAMAGDAGLDASEADAALVGLVDASLLTVERGGGTTSYRMLETVRAFAVARLHDHGLYDAACDRFVDHVVAESMGIISDSSPQWAADVLSRLLAHYWNVDAALRWCLAHDDTGARALRLSAVLWGVVQQRHTDDILTLCDETLRRWPQDDAPFYADAAATLATATYLTGDPNGAVEIAERALPMAETSPFAPYTLHRVLSYAARAAGDLSRATEMITRAAELARASGLPAMAMDADVFRAQLLSDAGSLDEALEILAAVRDEAAVAGSPVNEVWARSIAAGIQLRIDAGAAIGTIEEVLAEARRLDYQGAVSGTLRLLALAHLAAGHTDVAARMLIEVLDGVAHRGALVDLRAVLHTSAALLRRAGRQSWADIAASSAAFPIMSTMATVDQDLFPLSPVGEVRGRREIVTLARRELQAVLDALPVSAADDGVGRDASPADEDDTPSVFADRGDWWEISYAGRTVHIKASKGITDLGRLLAAPGREIHCLDLMGAVAEESSMGEAIDATARRQYEERARELQSEIDEAEADNDYARADGARLELDTLVDHLTSALGLGGRGRRVGGSAERARSAVTQRLRSTIRRLADGHPELGRHLTASITTGTYCCYRPEQTVDWRL